MLRDVEDPNGKKYFQDDQKNFFRNDMTGKYEGNQYAIDAVYKGEYIAYKNIIGLNETGDASTIMHELAHRFLAKLDKYSKQYNNLKQENPRLYQEMQAIRKFLKNDGGRFTVAQHEKFAHAFEVYIRKGWAPNNKLR